MLPVSLGCSFLIVSSVFSHVYVIFDCLFGILSCLLNKKIFKNVLCPVITFTHVQFNIFIDLETSNAIPVQLYRGGQFYWCRKLEYLEKTTDPSQETDELYHIMAV
jgi:hypothetical protein